MLRGECNRAPEESGGLAPKLVQVFNFSFRPTAFSDAFYLINVVRCIRVDVFWNHYNSRPYIPQIQFYP